VLITNVTSNSFDVELVANSTPRDLQTATFTFNPAPGATIGGSPTIPVNIAPQITAWYASAASQQYGSRFALTMPFTFAGSASAIGSVTVTLTNSAGVSSSVTGTP
jgi:hypothetical protein